MKYKVYGGSFKIFLFNQFMKMLRPRIIFQFKKDHLTIMKSVFVRVFFKEKKPFYYSLKIKSKKKVEKKSEAH